MTKTEKLSLLHDVRRQIADGMSDGMACAVCGISLSTLRRWEARFAAAGSAGLADAPRPGRPGICTPPAADADKLRRTYIQSNWRDGLGSVSASARLAARDPDSGLCLETRNAILYKGGDPVQGERKSKHCLPRAIRRAIRAADPTVRIYRDADAMRLGGIHAVECMRMVADPDAAGGRRRLIGGERQSADDGSVNFNVCVPWPRGDDPCSQRYGVRVSRFQLLASIDDAADFCPGWSFTMRAKSSYRDSDVCAFFNWVWGTTIVPERIVLEGGAWQAARTLEFIRASGAVWEDAKGRPRNKLIEGWWNRLWTVLSTRTHGQIGRYRDEMTRENDILLKCHAGTLDPRDYFPSLAEAMTAMEWSITYLNTERIDSAIYGSWVPAELYAQGLAAHPRPALPDGLEYLAARERELRVVRRDGVLVATAESPIGTPYAYMFASDDLLAYEGAKVWLHFDPWKSPVVADCTLADNFRDLRAGTVICRGATCLNSAPELIRSANGAWQVQFSDGLEAARMARARASAYTRNELRSVGLDGTRMLRASRDDREEQLGMATAPALSADKPGTLETTPPDFDALEAAAGIVARAG